jgi:hypothetical protein
MGSPYFLILCFQLLAETLYCILLKIHGLSAKRVRGKAESVHQHCPYVQDIKRGVGTETFGMED